MEKGWHCNIFFWGSGASTSDFLRRRGLQKNSVNVALQKGKNIQSHYVCLGELSFSVNVWGREKCRKYYLHTQSISKPFIQGSSILGISILVTTAVLQLNYRIFRGKIVDFHTKEESCKEP